MAKTMEHLSDFVFINVANMTLARRDSYLTHVKAGIKRDSLSALRQAPIHLNKLFPGQILKKAEEDIAQHENKVAQHSLPPATKRSVSTLTKDQTRVPEIRGPANWPGKILAPTARRGRARPHSSQHVWPRVSLLINDNV